jgi:hypothetical protein
MCQLAGQVRKLLRPNMPMCCGETDHVRMVQQAAGLDTIRNMQGDFISKVFNDVAFVMMLSSSPAHLPGLGYFWWIQAGSTVNSEIKASLPKGEYFSTVEPFG